MADPGRPRGTHVCKACGLEQPWAARCASCKAFGLSMRGIAEVAALGERAASALSGVPPDRPPAALTTALAIAEAGAAIAPHTVVPAVEAPGSSAPVSLVDVAEQTYVRDSTGLSPLDDVLGGGLVVGSVVVVFGEPGAGKCLGEGTPVLRHDGGVVPVEQVAIGDLLMGPDGEPRTVLATSRGRGELYRVVPIRGEPWVCNADHVLTLVHSLTDEVRDVELREWLASGSNLASAWKLFRVELTATRPKIATRTGFAVEPIGVGDYYGFELDRDGRFLLGDFTVTHNSSLVAQALSNSNLRVLYATGEETVAQVAGRARRINAASKRVYVVAETDLDLVLQHARTVRAQVICIDSIQTLVCADLGGGAGSPGQIKECTNRLVKYAKTTDVSVWIIGHVTNDGTLAGPKTLKHLVDVALELENGSGEEKLLRCAGKNRFGPTNVVGRFEMTAEGLEPIAVRSRSGSDDDEPGPEGFH